MHASSDLAAKCQAALAGGMDFPTLWNEVLKGHPLVVGPPMQGLRNGQACLEIRLLSGRTLVFDSAENRIVAG